MLNGENKQNGVMWLWELSRFCSPQLLSFFPVWSGLFQSLWRFWWFTLKVNLQLMAMLICCIGSLQHCYGGNVLVSLSQFVFWNSDLSHWAIWLPVCFCRNQGFILEPQMIHPPAPHLLTGCILIGQFNLVVFVFRNSWFKAEFCSFWGNLVAKNSRNGTFILFQCRRLLEPVIHNTNNHLLNCVFDWMMLSGSIEIDWSIWDWLKWLSEVV